MRRTTLLVLVLCGCGGAKPSSGLAPSPVVSNEPEPVPDREPLSWVVADREYIAALLAELRRTGERDHRFPGLVDFVGRVEALLRQAEHGELTKHLLLERFHELEEAMIEPVDEGTQVSLDDLREAMRQVRRGQPASPFAPP